jgi:hypothetical protein
LGYSNGGKLATWENLADLWKSGIIAKQQAYSLFFSYRRQLRSNGVVIMKSQLSRLLALLLTASIIGCGGSDSSGPKMDKNQYQNQQKMQDQYKDQYKNMKKGDNKEGKE